MDDKTAAPVQMYGTLWQVARLLVILLLLVEGVELFGSASESLRVNRVGKDTAFSNANESQSRTLELLPMNRLEPSINYLYR